MQVFHGNLLPYRTSIVVKVCIILLSFAWFHNTCQFTPCYSKNFATPRWQVCSYGAGNLQVKNTQKSANELQGPRVNAGANWQWLRWHDDLGIQYGGQSPGLTSERARVCVSVYAECVCESKFVSVHLWGLSIILAVIAGPPSTSETLDIRLTPPGA